MKTLFRRQTAVPQDHGSWVFLLTPLLIGLVAGKTFNGASLALVVASLAAFFMRQPLSMAVKVWSGRRPQRELPAALFWTALYGLIVLIAGGVLLYLGYAFVFLLAVPAAPILGWHLWLVGKRKERGQAGVEILATGALALTAPAAYWIGTDTYNPLGWVLWLLTWFQAAASIVYTFLRLEQREWKAVPDLAARLRAGWRSLGYTGFNLGLAAVLGAWGVIPALVFLAYLIQFADTVWGAFVPAVRVSPIAIGVRQLIVSTLFTIVFMLVWR